MFGGNTYKDGTISKDLNSKGFTGEKIIVVKSIRPLPRSEFKNAMRFLAYTTQVG